MGIKNNYQHTLSVAWTISISWVTALDTQHLSFWNSKSATCSEKLSTRLEVFEEAFAGFSCRIFLFIIHKSIYVKFKAKTYEYILTEEKKWSNCRSILLALAKISSLFLDAKWTSTLCVKWLNLSSLLSVTEIKFISFREASNSAVYFIISWKSTIFDASSGTA